MADRREVLRGILLMRIAVPGIPLWSLGWR